MKTNLLRRRTTLRLKSRLSITLLDAMADPQLFGPWFRDRSTWRVWRAVIAALFALPMTRHQHVLFTELTGRTKPPTRPVREAWIVAGRRGGKSFIAALVGVFLAAFVDYRRFLSPGEKGVVMILAADRRQARTIMRYATALLQGVPMLARLIERSGMESIDLTNQIVIEIHTASFRSVRGYTVVAALLDEVAYWRSEESANPDAEILAAIRPAMSTIPNALLLGISSPYSRRGVLWDSYEQHFGQERDPVLVFKGSTQQFNPSVPESVIAAAYADDPSAASAEYGGEFRSDIESFLQSEWISGATPEGVYELPARSGTSYIAYADPSGGSQDSFALGIAHSEDGRVVLDVARAWRAPFDPLAVVEEASEVLKTYGLQRVMGDRYAAEFVVSAFRECGVYYEPSQRTTSDTFLECLPLFATGALRLLDNRTLLNELRQLERRTGQTKDIVSHPPRGHDDIACAACGALLLAVQCKPADMGDAEVVSSAEVREQRDSHLVGDLGFADIGGTDDSPWNL